MESSVTVTSARRDSSPLNAGIITAITIPIVVVASFLLVVVVVVVGAVLRRNSKAKRYRT